MFFKKSETFVLLLIILLTLFLRLPSFFEPAWYGDEIIRLVVAREWFKGAVLYSEIFDNSPPLLYLIFGLAQDVFRLKVIATIWVIAAVTTFYFLASKLAKNFNLGWAYPILSVILFILATSTPILEGNIATAENFILFPVILAMFLVWEVNFVSKFFLPISAGVLMAIATLIRLQAITDLLAVIFFLLIFRNFKQVLLLLSAFFLIWLITFGTFFLTGNWQSAISAVFLGNFDYVNFANKLVLPFGLLILKATAAFIAVGILFATRKFFTKFEIFIMIWLIFGLLGASIGGRGFPHYLLQITPAASLLLATFVRRRFADFAKILAFLIIFVSFFILGKFYIPRSFSYYSNFLNFFKNYENYKNWFGDRITTSEIVSNYILTKTDKHDQILVLGDLPQIYLLSNRKPSGKYVVSYHLNFQKAARSQTLQYFLINPPKIVVVFPEGERQLPDIVPILIKNYKSVFKIDSGQIWERPF